MVMIGTSSSSDMATIIIAVSGAKSRKMVDSTSGWPGVADGRRRSPVSTILIAPPALSPRSLFTEVHSGSLRGTALAVGRAVGQPHGRTVGHHGERAWD